MTLTPIARRADSATDSIRFVGTMNPSEKRRAIDLALAQSARLRTALKEHEADLKAMRKEKTA